MEILDHNISWSSCEDCGSTGMEVLKRIKYKHGATVLCEQCIKKLHKKLEINFLFKR